MEKFGYMRLFRKDVGFLHRLYYRIAGVSPDHLLRFLHMQKAIGSGMKDGKPIRILDAGCGSGDYSIFLSEKYPDANIISIDIDEAGIARNKEVAEMMGVKNVFFQTGDVTALNYSDKFDFICCVDVLEQLPDQNIALEGMMDSLKDDGILFIHVPLKKRKPMPLFKYLNAYHKESATEHVAPPMSNSEFKEMLFDMGFKVVFQRQSFNHYLGEFCVSLVMLPVNNVFKALFWPLTRLLVKLDVSINHKNGNALAILLMKQ